MFKLATDPVSNHVEAGSDEFAKAIFDLPGIIEAIPSPKLTGRDGEAGFAAVAFTVDDVGDDGWQALGRVVRTVHKLLLRIEVGTNEAGGIVFAIIAPETFSLPELGHLLNWATLFQAVLQPLAPVEG